MKFGNTNSMKPGETVVYHASAIVVLLLNAVTAFNVASAAEAAPFPGKQSEWNGYTRYDFTVDEKPVLVVAPKSPAAGRPWVWHGEFFGHKPAPDIALLGRGFHIVYMRVPNMLGCPQAVQHWNAFYKELTTKYGLSKRAALVGLSRGGLYCYNWAAANPEKVACIYGDAPVCDFKSWPGGKGRGKGSPRDWQLVLKTYGFQDEAEALAYDKNPVDNLGPLAKAGVPLLHVYGDADKVVPWDENTGVIAERYRKLGGSIQLIGKPGVGHHPHGLDDSTPIVEFIAKHATVERAAATKSLKVYILAGQSNMQGHGKVVAEERANQGKGSLEWLAKHSAKSARFKHLLDETGKWAARDDVQIWYLERKGNLAPGFGHRAGYIGSELGFGQTVGDASDEPVLLIKVAWGGKSLAKDFRPPSSGGEVGPYYRQLLTHARQVLKDATTLFPQYADRKVELVGFGWHQGWNDRVNQAFNDQYEENLTNFIRDIRKDLATPNLPFVIAETGMSGREEKHPRALSLMKAQAAVARHEKFKGNVAFVGTRDFFRPKAESPSGQAYHWNSNAETYYLIGEGMGKAMLDLEKAIHKGKGRSNSAESTE